MRKAAYISLIPHLKNYSEKRFNNELWRIDEDAIDTAAVQKEQVEKMQKALKQHNLKLSEERRKKKEVGGRR